MAYIYCADIYCDDCGQAIRDRLTKEGKAPTDPDDEWSFDSDDFPKRAGDDEESDIPQHCAAEDCINAIELDGGKVGFLFGELTRDGIDYIKDAIIDANHDATIDGDGTTWCKEIVGLWYRHYSDRGYRFRIAPNWI